MISVSSMFQLITDELRKRQNEALVIVKNRRCFWYVSVRLLILEREPGLLPSWSITSPPNAKCFILQWWQEAKAKV